METNRTLTKLASVVVAIFEKPKSISDERYVTVNPLVSRIASWYEKLRKAMEYREEEVILRATIERVLRRRLLLGGNGKTTAEPLIRELLWARYLEEKGVPESAIETVEKTIDLYLSWRIQVLKKHKFPQHVIDEWTYHLMSSNVEQILNPNIEKETISNFMFQIMKEHVFILDDTEQTKQAQVFIAVRRAFARDDLAFLRYHLFRLYFGELNSKTLDQIVMNFPAGYKEITRELQYPKREKIYAYIKKRTAPFLILEDVLTRHKGHIRELITDQEALRKTVYEISQERYAGISSKVKRAIIRSVLFILLTKVAFAFFIEGTYEKLVYGQIIWSSIILNTSIPPLLMLVVSAFIRIPNEDNTKRIFSTIENLLFNEHAKLGNVLTLKTAKDKPRPIMILFDLLWACAFLISFGGIIYVLSKIGFNIVSQAIFIFFLAIVSFLSYRISVTAHIYTIGDKQDFLTPIVDFLFMPIVRVGRQLTLSVSKINFLLFIFDFFIETPFKVLFAFFEQWFHFLHSKREELE